MSDPTIDNTSVEDQSASESALTTNEDSAPSTDAPTPAAPESTVGTGTAMALGCVAGTIVLILFGLIFLAVQALL